MDSAAEAVLLAEAAADEALRVEVPVREGVGNLDPEPPVDEGLDVDDWALIWLLTVSLNLPVMPVNLQ